MALVIVLVAQFRGIASHSEWPWLVWVAAGSGLTAAAAGFFIRCAEDGLTRDQIKPLWEYSACEKWVALLLLGIIASGLVLTFRDELMAKGGIPNGGFLALLAGSLLAHLRCVKWAQRIQPRRAQNAAPERIGEGPRHP
jgi:hypothetical protein